MERVLSDFGSHVNVFLVHFGIIRLKYHFENTQVIIHLMDVYLRISLFVAVCLHEAQIMSIAVSTINICEIAVVFQRFNIMMSNMLTPWPTSHGFVSNMMCIIPGVATLCSTCGGHIFRIWFGAAKAFLRSIILDLFSYYKHS